MCIKRCILFSGFFCWTVSALIAQNNYWTNQYGAKSSLMAGAVVGGVHDNSAIYYNPAGIANIDSVNVSVSANAYGFESLQLKNGAGNNLDLNSFRILIYPQLISGLIKFKKIPQLKMAYGLLTRYRQDIKMHTENRMFYDVIPSEPGKEYYYGSFDYELNSISQWGGITLAYKISPRVSIGLTTFASYTHFDDRRSLISSADVGYDSTAYTTQINSLQYNVIDNVGLLWKLGMQFDFDKIKFGFALTTPSINIWGTSRIGRTLEYFNQNQYLSDTTAVGQHQSWIVSDDRSGLYAQLRTPFSVSAGVDFHFPKTQSRLTLTMEYFLPIDFYTVAKSDSPVYIRPTALYNGAQVKDFMQIGMQTAGIFNAAIGFEQQINPKVTLYAGVRTDLNNTIDLFSNRASLYNTLNPSFSHFIHFSSGVTYRKGMSDITLGLNYGLGITNSKRQPLNLSNPGVYDNNTGGYLLLQGPRENTMTVNSHQLSVVIGYTYYFKKFK